MESRLRSEIHALEARLTCKIEIIEAKPASRMDTLEKGFQTQRWINGITLAVVVGTFLKSSLP